MSAVTHGFDFCFASGMFDRMFGGLDSFCESNFFSEVNFTPTFFPPSFKTSVFMQDSMPSANMSFQNFSMPAMNNNFNFNSNFNWNSFNMNNMWSSFNIGDSFTSSASGKYSDSDTANFSYDAEALKKKWSKKKPNLTQGFYNKVVQVAKRVNCDPNDLMCLMNSESGINASVPNKAGSGAVGLIQFMPKTAKALGTSSSALKAMSAEQQMVYVEKCIMNSKKSAGLGNQKIGPGTLYALIFLPARAGRDILTTRGEAYYNSNKGLDLDNDGKISKADLAKRIRSCNA